MSPKLETRQEGYSRLSLKSFGLTVWKYRNKKGHLVHKKHVFFSQKCRKGWLFKASYASVP